MFFGQEIMEFHLHTLQFITLPSKETCYASSFHFENGVRMYKQSNKDRVTSEFSLLKT